MSKIILKKNGTDYLFGLIPLHYPADRVYLDGDTDKNVQDALDEIQMSNILNAVYPVGSIYMSINNVNPGTLFGGTWVAWGSGKVPVGVDANDTDFDTVEETGGTKSHKYTPQGSNGNVGATTLTAAQSGVPAHAHGLNSHKHSVGAHAHGLNSHTHTMNHTHLIARKYFSTDSKLDSADKTLLIQGLLSDGTYFLCGSNTTADVGKSGASSASSTGQASGSTANSTAFDSGAASGNTANNTAANASKSHTHSGSTFTGVESTQSHLQPYITCYMWKRTA